MCIWQIVKLYGAGIHACLLFQQLTTHQGKVVDLRPTALWWKMCCLTRIVFFLGHFHQSGKGNKLKRFVYFFFLFYREYLYIEFLQVDALILHCGWKFEVANYIKAQYTFYNPVTIKIDILFFCKFNQVEWILS